MILTFDGSYGSPSGARPWRNLDRKSLLKGLEEGNMKISALVIVGTLVIVGCGTEPAPPVGEQAPPADEWKAPTNLFGGCILTTPIGEVPEDLYTITDVVPTDDIPPFTKKLTVYGLTLAAGDDASDDFMRLVAKTITEIFPRAEGLDLAKQEEVLRNQYLYKALIPVPVGEDMSFFEEDQETFFQLASQNSICDIIMSEVPGQVMEVVEHILHFVSDTGLHYAFPAEWGISKESEIAVAMNEAIEKGYYEVEQYGDIDNEEEHHRVLIQEFAYWAISTYWDLQGAYGPVGEAEWNIVTAAELKEKMPALSDMIERTVATVMVAPSLETLQQIGPTRAEEREARD
jgi:hypothetical protein